jgi:hypothetical protein
MKKEKIHLYLDDVRKPTDDSWQVVTNYNQFVSHVRLNGLENYEVISLDHDLGEEAMNEFYNNALPNYKLNYDNILNEKTGYDCAKWLVAESMTKKIPLPQIYVHSANPIGSANIMGYINNYLMSCKLPQTCIRIKVENTINE